MKNQIKRTVAIFLAVCFLVSVTVAAVSASTLKKGYSINIEKATLENNNFRKVLYTAQYSQLQYFTNWIRKSSIPITISNI